MNIFEDIPEKIPEELVEVFTESESVRIERIISDGHGSPEGFWYDQDQHEWVMVVSGSAVLEFEDETVALEAGGYLLIPAHKKHRVKSTAASEKTVWIAVFFR
jgi:cupin 2 domain-containing protein